MVPMILLFPLFIHAESRAGDDGGPITANLPLNEVSIRAYRYFHREWPAVAGETWYKTDGQLMVTFLSHEHRMKAFFNLKGAFLYSLEYYAGKDISADIGAMIRNKYPDSQIKVVTEVSNMDKTAFYVTIENSATVRTLSIVNGKMEVVGELINGGGVGSTLAQH